MKQKNKRTTESTTERRKRKMISSFDIHKRYLGILLAVEHIWFTISLGPTASIQIIIDPTVLSSPLVCALPSTLTSPLSSILVCFSFDSFVYVRFVLAPLFLVQIVGTSALAQYVDSLRTYHFGFWKKADRHQSQINAARYTKSR